MKRVTYSVTKYFPGEESVGDLVQAEEVIDGAGHLVMLENPRGLSQAILGFLRGL